MDLLLEAGLESRGRKAAPAFEDSTNLSHMTFRRHGAMAFVIHAESIQTYQREQWLPKEMRSWGAPEDEITEAIASMPISEPVAFTVHGMGFREPGVSPHLEDRDAFRPG